MRLALRRIVPLAAVILGACAGGIVPPSPTRAAPQPLVRPLATVPTPPPAKTPPAVPGANARTTGVVAGPPVTDLPITAEQADRARVAFRLSCAALQKRGDTSGLAAGSDWAPACRAAAAPGDAIAFFRAQFDTVQIGTGQAFATGYYEPEIAGSRTRDAAHTVPVYARPADLIEVDLGDFSAGLSGKQIRGRVVAGQFVPYHDRGAIDDGALDRSGTQPIAWAADYIEFFFLQIQGSGRLRLPDGSVMRIGYAGQNGRDYVGIGALMRDRGLLAPGQASMQGLMGWLRTNPIEGRAIMRENKSYVFFRELTGAGPLGALGLPVTGRVSIAADPAFVPLGAPVWVDLDRNKADGLWIAQDTGGAIKGANRIDTFWGAGDEARRIAGGMAGRGTALLLVPRGTAARLARSPSDVAQPQR